MICEPGDIVQIDPSSDKVFGGCFMVVTSIHPWGAKGYFNIPGQEGLAYYRCEYKNLKVIGQAHWEIEEKNNG